MGEGGEERGRSRGGCTGLGGQRHSHIRPVSEGARERAVSNTVRQLPLFESVLNKNIKKKSIQASLPVASLVCA